MTHPIALLNTSICTTVGSYAVTVLSVDHARWLVRNGETVSAIGHQSTADALAELLGVPVEVNRIAFEQQPGQVAIVLKLRGRLPEGVLLDRAALDEIGFDLWLMQRGLVSEPADAKGAPA